MEISTLQAVIQEIRKHENENGEKLTFYENVWQKIPFWIALLSFIAALCLSVTYKWFSTFSAFSRYDLRTTGYLLVLISIIAVIVYELIVFIPIVPSLFRPTATFLDKIDRSSKSEDKLINNLAVAEVTALDQALERLDYEVNTLEIRIETISGVLQKIGIMPAAVALYIAYSKKDIPHSGFLYDNIDYVLYFVFGIYLGAIMTRNVIDKLKLFAILIKNAKERAELRQKIANPLQ